MALAPGVRLGPYEVFAAIGKGGMGEVSAMLPATWLRCFDESEGGQ